MKNSTKAALLSAFLFPGVGHIYLKKYITGFILVAVSVSCVYYLMTKALEKAMVIVDKIESGSVPLDPNAISELIAQQTMGAEYQSLNVATMILILCWIIGIVDCYRLRWTNAGENLE